MSRIYLSPEQQTLAATVGTEIYEARKAERYSERRDPSNPAISNIRGLLAEMVFEEWTEGRCPANTKVFTDRPKDVCDFRAGPLLGDVKSNILGGSLAVRQGTARHNLYVLVWLEPKNQWGKVVGWTTQEAVRAAKKYNYHNHYLDMQHVVSPRDLRSMDEFKKLYWDVLGGCK